MGGIFDIDDVVTCVAVAMLVVVAGLLAADFLAERRAKQKRLAQRDRLRWS